MDTKTLRNLIKEVYDHPFCIEKVRNSSVHLGTYRLLFNHEPSPDTSANLIKIFNNYNLNPSAIRPSWIYGTSKYLYTLYFFMQPISCFVIKFTGYYEKVQVSKDSSTSRDFELKNGMIFNTTLYNEEILTNDGEVICAMNSVMFRKSFKIIGYRLKGDEDNVILLK